MPLRCTRTPGTARPLESRSRAVPSEVVIGAVNHSSIVLGARASVAPSAGIERRRNACPCAVPARGSRRSATAARDAADLGHATALPGVLNALHHDEVRQDEVADLHPGVISAA